MAALASVDPSSTSNNSQSVQVWARTLSTASAMKSPASLKIMITETTTARCPVRPGVKATIFP